MNIFRLALKENSRHKVNLILVCILPFPLLLIPANETSFPFGINLYGLLVFYTAFLLARPVAEDRMKGMILRIAASPVSTFRYLGSHLAAYFLLLGIQILLFLAGSALVHRLEVLVYLNLLCLYLSFAVMSTAFAVAWNSLFRSFNLSFGLFAGIGSLMCLVSGISMPLEVIPLSVQRYTMFLPTYWLPYGIDALQPVRYPDLMLAHAILLAYAVVFLLAGTRRKL
jgi:ABC-2 type transport system permease protein